MKSLRYLHGKTEDQFVVKVNATASPIKFDRCMPRGGGILPFYTGVWLSQEVLVQFKGGGSVPVQPHCIPCTLSQLVSHRCGYEGNRQSIYLFISLSKKEKNTKKKDSVTVTVLVNRQCKKLTYWPLVTVLLESRSMFCIYVSVKHRMPMYFWSY